MPHKMYGVGYNVVDGTPTLLVDDMGGLIEILLETLGIVEARDETYDVSLLIDMTM